MHSKQDIQFLLESAGVRPNKRFGQHFLIDLNLMTKLVEAAEINSRDVVLEVGCGTGSLTEELAEKAGKVIAVEIDHTLAKIASRLLADSKNVLILNADVLKDKHTISSVVADAVKNARKESKGRFLLVANLPYSVASGLMMNLISGDAESLLIPNAMYVTVQKEVAERMIAEPGGKEYGTLSIFLNATGEIKLLRTLKPSVFWPQPQVNSAMISYVRNAEKAKKIENMRIFSNIIGLFMQHRRKMIKATVKFAADDLANVIWNKALEQCGIDGQKRPEVLTSDDFVCLANLSSKYASKNGENSQK